MFYNNNSGTMNSLSLMSIVFDYPITIGISVIFILIALINWNSKRKNKSYWAEKNVKPGAIPSLLRIIIQSTDLALLDQKLVKKYGKIFGVHQFGRPTLYCAEPEIIGIILSKDFSTFSNRRTVLFNNEILDNWMTKVKDEKWKRIRAIVSPTFSSGKLRKMRPIIDDCVQCLVNDFNHLINADNDVDVKKVYGAFTMNVITQVAFGTKVDALNDGNNPIIVNAKKLFNRDIKLLDVPKFLLRLTFPKIAKFFGINIILIEVMDFFSKLTRKIIDERRTNKSIVKRFDFLQLLLDAMENDDELDKTEDKTFQNDGIVDDQKFITNNKKMSIEEVISQCVLFFVAGYESTSTTLSYCVYNLACNTEMQQILYEEAKNVFKPKAELDYDLIHGLKYADAVICETLRLFPPQKSLDREASGDFIFNEGIKISKGDFIQIPITALHKNPEYFPEPEKFKPQRFFPENRSHHPYAYLPFGAGPRNCVAQRFALFEAKLALLYSVYNFRFSVTNETEYPPKTFLNGGFIVPRKVMLKVEKR